MDDQKFLEEAKDWPCFPICPVKNYNQKDEAGFPAFGLVVAGAPTVFLKNLCELSTGFLGPQLEDVEKKEYASFQELVDDGWIVD